MDFSDSRELKELIMPKIMALDYGLKRIGVSVSDALLISAQGRPTIIRRSLDDDLGAIETLVISEEITEIVIGLPLNMDGSRGPMSQAVEEFAALVQARVDKPIRFWDERLTTSLAEQTLLEGNCRRDRRRRERDRLSAIIILQSYLDHLEARSSQDNSGTRS